MYEDPSFSTFLPVFVIVCVFYFIHLSAYELVWLLFKFLFP